MAKLKLISRIEGLEKSTDYRHMSIDELIRLSETDGVELMKCTPGQAVALIRRDTRFDKLCLSDGQIAGLVRGDMSALSNEQLEHLSSAEFWQ